MARVGRGAILAHRRARGIVGVEPVVTIEAQAAERAQPERGEVASVWWVVIGDSRWGDAARLGPSQSFCAGRELAAMFPRCSSLQPQPGSRSAQRR